MASRKGKVLAEVGYTPDTPVTVIVSLFADAPLLVTATVTFVIPAIVLDVLS